MTPKLVEPILPPPIDSEEAALKWAEQMVLDCEAARRACDTPLLASGKNTGKALRRRETAYLLKHGAALGALAALLRCRKIGPIPYNAFVTRVQATLLGTVTGVVGG